jgi:hypothetical protein
MKLTRNQVILAVLGLIALQATILLAWVACPSANAAMSSSGTAW